METLPPEIKAVIFDYISDDDLVHYKRASKRAYCDVHTYIKNAASKYENKYDIIFTRDLVFIYLIMDCYWDAGFSMCVAILLRGRIVTPFMLRFLLYNCGDYDPNPYSEQGKMNLGCVAREIWKYPWRDDDVATSAFIDWFVALMKAKLKKKYKKAITTLCEDNRFYINHCGSNSWILYLRSFMKGDFSADEIYISHFHKNVDSYAYGQQLKKYWKKYVTASIPADVDMPKNTRAGFLS